MNVMNLLRVFTYALALGLPAGPLALAQEAHQHQMHGASGAPMMEKCQAMMADREKMTSEMRAAEAKLDELIAAMNAAQGDAKVEALARVVTEMAEQRKTVMSKMTARQPQMMQHMMEHIRQGMMEKDDKAMECPMMKGLTGPEK